MEEAGAPLVFREEWVEQIKGIIDNKKSLANVGTNPRVATALLDTKREAYIPHFVSLGPYHHWKLEKKVAASSSAGDSYEFRELKMSNAEAYKVQSAAAFWRSRGISLNDIVEKIKGLRQQIQDFYDWPISTDGEYPDNFALMMAIDASFLLRFLSGSSDADMKCLSRLEVSIKCDILKLENQIPQFVLTSVLDFANDAESFNGLLQKMYKLSPFYQLDRANTDIKTQINDQPHSIQIAETQIKDQPHLLGYLHAFVSQLIKVIEKDEYSKPTRFQRLMHFLEVIVGAVFTILHIKHPYKEGRREILKSYNAGELEKAGIKFKSSFEKPEHIRFDKYSGTLYLPQITVSEMQTEVLLRNMLALEFNDADLGESVTRYVGLMDCLIDTADDVRLLRESQVICRGSLLLTDDKIATMWNGMCHPIFTGHLEPPEVLNDTLKEVLIRKYYMSIVNKLLWEFWLDHLSKPGKGVALVVCGLILLMTIIQTYCTWKQWQHEMSPK